MLVLGWAGFHFGTLRGEIAHRPARVRARENGREVRGPFQRPDGPSVCACPARVRMREKKGTFRSEVRV